MEWVGSVWDNNIIHQKDVGQVQKSHGHIYHHSVEFQGRILFILIGIIMIGSFKWRVKKFPHADFAHIQVGHTDSPKLWIDS